jgi:hypothetical protein
MESFFFLKNTKISIFGGISKFLELLICRQILADFGQFWVNLGRFVALAMVDNMPKVWLNLITFEP